MRWLWEWLRGPAPDPREAVVAGIRAIERRCRGPLAPGARDAIRSALAAGLIELAQELDRTQRLGCGYDVNELIVSGPLDGQLHSAPCPNCGVELTWRAPEASDATA